MIRIRFGVRWTTYRRSAGMMKMRYHGRWHGVQRVGTRLVMHYRGRMRKVVPRGGTVMMRVGRRWRKFRKTAIRKRTTRRIRRRRRPIAMRIRVKGRWKSVYKRGNGFRVRCVTWNYSYYVLKTVQLTHTCRLISASMVAVAMRKLAFNFQLFWQFQQEMTAKVLKCNGTV